MHRDETTMPDPYRSSGTVGPRAFPRRASKGIGARANADRLAGASPENRWLEGARDPALHLAGARHPIVWRCRERHLGEDDRDAVGVAKYFGAIASSIAEVAMALIGCGRSSPASEHVRLFSGAQAVKRWIFSSCSRFICRSFATV